MIAFEGTHRLKLSESKIVDKLLLFVLILSDSRFFIMKKDYYKIQIKIIMFIDRHSRFSIFLPKAIMGSSIRTKFT